MTTLTKEEALTAVAEWIISSTKSSFLELSNSAIPDQAQQALYSLEQGEFKTLENFVALLEAILKHIPFAFDDSIRRAKIYYCDAKVSEIEDCKSTYITVLSGIISKVKSNIC